MLDHQICEVGTSASSKRPAYKQLFHVPMEGSEQTVSLSRKMKKTRKNYSQ